MHYTLLFYLSPEEFSHRTDPLQQEEYLASWSHYVKALSDSGIVVSGASLYTPETATTLRRYDDPAYSAVIPLAGWKAEMLVRDGPITEAKEQLGGFFIVDVPDHDTALEWATRCPLNAVEVRQNLPPIK